MLTRREALKVMGRGIGLAGLYTFPGIRKAGASKKSGTKVIVLGIDGMDPRLVGYFVNSGRMPNTMRLSERGCFSPLRTSMPPQSPVAWANFITGMNPGGHGVFDFIHRDPHTFTPFLSTSRAYPPEKTISLGDWVFPLKPGGMELLRKGKAFWNILQEHGVNSTVFRVPSNFPPEESNARTISGMGTPDILGSYGTFLYFSDDKAEIRKSPGGGKIYPVHVVEDTVTAYLEGPPNTFRKGRPAPLVPFNVFIDPKHHVAKIVIQNNEFLLRDGEWSDWIVVNFEMVPLVEKVSAICRLYLKETHPHFRLYVSPLNINPADPSLPISTPSDYASEIFENVGYFYTQGMPQETKALSGGILTDEEYLDQAMLVLKERLKLYEYELDRFKEGFLFFYFSSLDLNSHMFWRTLDRTHPLYSESLKKKFGWFLPFLYEKMDEVIGRAMKRADDRTTLIIMSDHGFSSFKRGFNLNTWLLNNSYAALHDPLSQEETDAFDNVDWSKTYAYGQGINSLYLNISGREKEGIIPPGEKADNLVSEIAGKLLRVKDEKTGERIITHAYKPDVIYSGKYVERAPDLIIGYNRNYRASWETILGKYPREQIVDNKDKWSGDHCMDNIFLPGVFICNKKLSKKTPAIHDLAPTILREFGIERPPNMTGSPVFG